uniref:CSON001884 protein n=1 Tax=Culicoides sonorensis TaxID=179676 RepID=A0A336KZC4_CULSO
MAVAPVPTSVVCCMDAEVKCIFSTKSPLLSISKQEIHTFSTSRRFEGCVFFHAIKFIISNIGSIMKTFTPLLERCDVCERRKC